MLEYKSAYGIAVPALWGLMGLLWLRCEAYVFDLCSSGCLWDFQDLLMGLRCQAYRDVRGCCWGVCVWSMGLMARMPIA